MQYKKPSAFVFLALAVASLVAILVWWVAREPAGHLVPLADLGSEQSADPGASAPREPIPASGGALPSVKPITRKPFADPSAPWQSEGIGGVVVDEGSIPIENASCELYEDVSFLRERFSEGELIARTASGSDGAFLFEGDTLSVARRYVLKVTHGSYAPERRPLDLENPALGFIKVTMVRGTAISGFVRSASGVALENATVTVYDANQNAVDPNGSVDMTATTDASGSYSVAHASPGMKKMRASLAGYATAVRIGVKLESGTPLDGVDFTLAEGASISGRIVAQGTAESIAGAWVSARATGTQVVVHFPEAAVEPAADLREQKMEKARRGSDRNPPDQKPRITPPAHDGTVLAVRSRADGTYAIDGAHDGMSYVLSVNVAGFVPPVQRPVTAPARDADFILAPSARIVGRVVDDETGKPIAHFGVAVCGGPDEVLVSAFAKRNFGPPKFADGRFEYVDVAPGRHWLVAEARGYAGGRSGEIVIGAGERKDGVEIRLVRGATVKGRVVDAKGIAVADATVQADPMRSSDGARGFLDVLRDGLRRDLREVRTAADGSFSLPHLMAGFYTLRVRHLHFGPHSTPRLVVPASGETTHPDIVLARGCTIRGRIRLPDGTPDRKASVRVMSASQPAVSQLTSDTDSEGRFEITGLAAGEYQVLVAQRNGQIDFGPLLSIAAARQGRIPATIPTCVLAEGEVKDLDL